MNAPTSVPRPKPTLAAPAGASAGSAESLSGNVPASKRRLRKHADYQRAYKAARKQFSSSMSWFLALRSTLPAPPALPVVPAGPRVGLTVGKVLGKAHERNLIKRRMREAVRSSIDELPDGIDLILHPKRSVMAMDFVKLQAEVLRIFRQAATQTVEMKARLAQSRPVLGPEAVQAPFQRRTAQPALKRALKPGEARVQGDSVSRS